MSNDPSTYTIVRGRDRYAGAPDVDSYVNLDMEGKQREFLDSDRSVLLNLEERFDTERQGSNIFRVAGKITNLYDNSISGKSLNYNQFTNFLYYIDPTTSASMTTPVWSGFPQYYEFEFLRDSGIPNHINFVNKSASTYNWMVYLSYASGSSDNHVMQYTDEKRSQTVSFESGNGVPYVIQQRTYNGVPLITFYCGVNHNLDVGQWVETSVSYNNNNLFQVYQLGDDTYGSQTGVFSIYNVGYTGTTFANNAKGTFKRIVEISNSAETKSQYYIRKNALLTSILDLDLTQLGFESNAFPTIKQLEYSALTPNLTQRVSIKDGSLSFGFSFDKDIDITNIIDNLGRPVTDLYVTIVERGYMGWFNKPYNNTVGTPALQVGWGFNFLENSIDSYWDSVTNPSDNIPTGSYTHPDQTTLLNKTFYYNEFLQEDDILKGDFCEYNQYDLQEYVLSPIYHKYTFNSNYYQTASVVGTNQKGYYYQVHYPVPVRAYSPYIETAAKQEVINVPNYATFYDSVKLWRWRDIYPYGYVDAENIGLDYPYLNNAHYPFIDLLFLQTPDRRNINQQTEVIIQPITDDCE
jgi:hypothetical protein